MGYNVIKLPDDLMPFTYGVNYIYKVRSDVDDFIYYKDSKIDNGFHPARCISVMLGLLHNYYSYNEMFHNYYRDLLTNSMMKQNALYFPYKFNFLAHGDRKNVLRKGWVSGFCQGMALILILKSYKKIGLFDGLNIASKIRNTFGKLPILNKTDNGNFYEEYEGNCDALNGHIYALYGLYYHWHVTDDAYSLELLEKGLDYVVNNFEKFRNNGNASYYCTKHKVITDKVGGKYHSVHINQLLFLYKITNDIRFKQFADELLSDFKPERKTGTELNLLFP